MVSPGGEETGGLVWADARTRGRPPPPPGVAPEGLIETTQRGRAGHPRETTGGHGREHQYIVTLCDGRLQSLAEISARMQLPLGVARVLVADMAADGLVAIYAPAALDGNDPVGTEL